MKKEAGKKGKLWLWLGIGLAALVVIGAVVGVVFLAGQGGKAADDGRPDLYYNLDRDLYVEKGSLSSNREKAEDGLYHIRCAFDGEEVDIVAADKQLVNFIDTMSVMSFVFDGDGYVVDAIAAKEVATVVGEDVYVQSLGDGVININSSIVMNGMKKAIPLVDMSEIYDVTRKAEVGGQQIALQELGVMDKVSIYGDAEGNVTHIFLTSRPKESKVYWRANQFVSSSKTTRVPDENGYYTIPFYCEGEYVEFKCKDVVEVNYIDKQSYYSCHFGLVFDEDGYIIEAIHSYEAIRGIVRSERFDITAIDGNNISTTKIIGSNAGTTDQFTIDENVTIYDVSPAAVSEGRAGLPVDSLSVGDRIVCFADAEGKPLFIYIAEHVVEEAVWCYNIERKYDSTLQQTKRVPDANGWYTFKVFAEGVVRYVKTKDLATANAMDSVGAAVFGLTLDGDVVKNVYNVRSVFGYTHYAQGRYITSVSGSIFSCFKTSAPNTLITGIMAPDCKIWNLSPVGTYGAETKLQYGDYIYAYQSPDLTIQQIFVMRRVADLPVYIGTGRMYNSTKKETTRTPDADGWYVYEVYRDGKKMTVKTQSKAMASQIDAINPAVMGLRVGSDGVVYDAYEARLVYGGYRRAHGYTVVSIKGNIVETNYKNADGTIATRTLTLASDCKTVDMTLNFGQSTKVRVGDVITAFTDIYDETKLLVVRNRKVDYLYWNQLKMYDDTNKVTMRKTDADGWYVYTLLRSDGKVVTLKTQDAAIANKVDYYGGAFTLSVSDGVIKGVGSPSYAKNTNGTSLLNYDVVAVSGKTVTLRNSKETVKINLSSDCKIYEVGPDAATFGAAVKLKVGDRVRAYKSDKNDTYTYVFIRFHDSRELGVDGRCDVCKKDVKWEPWVGGSFATAGGHFYLPADITTDYLPCSTGRSKTFPNSTVCLDLNGHTYYRTTGRAMYVYTNGTLNIMDTVGGGTVTGGGIVNGTSGGVLGVAGGTVNFYSGTLRLADEHNVQYRAGVVYVSKGSDEKATYGTFNMYGGVIENGEVLARGGNVDVNGGIFNMYDGVIRDGFVGEGHENDVTCYGGNIAIRGNSTFNMYGGTISGGEAYKNGGNIYSGTGVTNIYGGTITGGTSKISGGGNIYVNEKLNIAGGTISGGHSLEKSGGNIYVANYNENTALTISGGTITDGTCGGYGGNIYCEVPTTIANATIANGTAAKDGGNIYCNKAAVLTDSAITGGKAVNGGNIYGLRNWTVTGCTIEGGATTDAKGSGGNIYVASGDWVLENNTISNGVSGARGGNIYAGNATVTMNSGVITGGASGSGNANGGGNICTVSNATFVLNGGEVTDGVSINTAGNILAGSGALQINGGTVSGGTASKAGADIYVYGGSTDVAISGGDLGVVELAAVNTLVMSGTPEFENLIFGGGVVADITDLDKNAQIPLIAGGTVTTTMENAEAYLNCFVPVDEKLSVFAEEGTLCVAAGVKPAYCAHCDKNVNWKLWTGAGTDGHYYVEGQTDVTAAAEIPAGSSLVLDLAGGKLNNTETRAFYVYGELVVLDSVGGGEIIGSGAGADWIGGVIRVNGGSFRLMNGTLHYSEEAAGAKQGAVLYVQNNAVVDLEGGVITGGRTTERGGNILINTNSVVNLSGTEVSQGSSGSGNSNGGGNIFVLGDGLLNITGGKVYGGTSVNSAGNILIGTGYMKMSGGEVYGGTATKAPGVYAYFDQSNIEITGGYIDNLTFTDAETFSVSGDPKIDLLTVAEGKSFTLGELTDGAEIYVSASGVFTTANENAQAFVDAGYVKSAESNKNLVVEDNKLAISTAPSIPEGATQAPCEHCGGEDVIWYNWDGINTNGHYVLDAQMNLTGEIEIPAGNTLVLDLKGNELTNTQTRVFRVNGTLAILDTENGGEVVGSYAGTDNGGVIYVDGGNFDLYNGIIRYNADAAGAKRGGVLYMQGACVVNLRGGVITDGKTSERGGNIYVAAGVLNLCGATVQNGTANSSSNANGGGNIFMLGDSVTTMTAGKVIDGTTTKTGGNICVGTATFIMEGGEISGGTSAGVGPDLYVYYNKSNAEIKGGKISNLNYTDANSFKLSGNPVIEKFVIAADKKVALGVMTEGASVKVMGSGVFTDETDNASAALNANYITTFDAYELKLVNKALSVTFVTNHYCAHCDTNVDWTAWDGTATNGHYYLAANKAPTAVIEIKANAKLVLDLNSFKVSNNSSRTFYVYGELAILDLVGGGEVMGSQAGNTMQGGVIRVRGGKFDLYGGTVRYNPAAAGANQGGVIYVQNYNDKVSTVNLRDGVIEGGKALERGGNIFINGEGSVVNLMGATIKDGHTGTGHNSVGGGNVFVMGGGLFNMTGGKILDGVADNYGGNVGIGSGSFAISGGEISGGTATLAAPDVYLYYNEGSAQFTGGTIGNVTYKDAASFAISGNAVIEKLDIIASGKLVELGTLTEGASITVDAEGVFTTVNANAAEYVTKGYIKAVEGKTLKEEEGALSVN